jgi:PAS domain S-box-containing protein
MTILVEAKHKMMPHPSNHDVGDIAGVGASQPQVGDVLRLDLRQNDGTTLRVLGIVRSIHDEGPDAGHSAVLEYVHEDTELELVDWARAWEASALEQVDALVLLFDRNANMIWMNSAVERKTGWRSRDLVGRPYSIIQQLLQFDVELATIARSLLSTGSWSACVRLQTQSGQPCLVHVRVTALRGPDGAIKGATAVMRDETELHRLRAVAEAVNLATNVGQMFSGIRHELGNPINSLKTALTVLRNNWSKFDPVRIDHYFQRMLVEVGRVEYLLRSLRNFSAFEDVQLCPCSTRTLFTDIAPVVTTTSRERGVAIDIDVTREFWVKGDNRALYQALLNLISNAFDAVAQIQGRVILRARKVSTGTIAVEVVDNGEGIPAGDREAVLRPFYTTRAHGTGLGLPIVQRLAHAMGGELVLDSHPGRGTTARLLLTEIRQDG